MGFELDAFLGTISDLRTWKAHLPSAVVCELSGDLGMVPVTGLLCRELRVRLGEEGRRLDAGPSGRSWPFPSYVEGVRRWGLEASRGTTIAYVSMGEFGNQSHEKAAVWADGRQVLSETTYAAALGYLRDQAGLDLGTKPFNLETHRGEDAAEKWAAAAGAQD